MGRAVAALRAAPEPGYEAMIAADPRDRGRALPPAATVLVVSKGDDELLDLERRARAPLPAADDGPWAGHHPADSEEAVAALEAMRERGGEFIVFPRTGMWWLEHYGGLNEHLEERLRRSCATRTPA